MPVNIGQLDFYRQALLLLASLLGLSALLMLGQRRLIGLISIFAVQSCLLSLIAILVGFRLSNPYLYFSAAFTMGLKAVFIPWILGREAVHLNIQQDSGTLTHKIVLMFVGAGLMLFSDYILHPIVNVTSAIMLNALTVSLSMLLLGMLLLITHREAIAYMIGFMSIENGLFFSAILATNGMPIVIESDMVYDALVAVVLFGIFFLHIRSSGDSLAIDKLNRLPKAD